MSTIIKMDLGLFRRYVPRFMGDRLELVKTGDKGRALPSPEEIGVFVEMTTEHRARIRVNYPRYRPCEMFYLYRPDGWPKYKFFATIVVKLGTTNLIVETTVEIPSGFQPDPDELVVP